MGRWKPDSRARLQAAAMDLYATEGFTATTAAAIAERAGLSESTFFRHFADKREALFGGEQELRDHLARAAQDAEPGNTHAAVTAALTAVAGELQPRRAELRRRGAVVALHPELQERELIKLASWSGALEQALRARGEPAALLVAEVAIAVLNASAQRWLEEETDRPLIDVVHDHLAVLAAVLEPSRRHR